MEVLFYRGGAIVSGYTGFYIVILQIPNRMPQIIESKQSRTHFSSGWSANTGTSMFAGH